MKHIVLLLAALSPCARAAQPDYDAAAKEARSILTELVAADTSNPPGNEARAVEIGARYLKAAGIPYEIAEFAPGRQNLVARLKGTGSAPPLLLLSHVDVVGADGQTWSSKPHELTEKDGYLVGRGSSDDLGMAAISLETLLMIKRSGKPLKKDLIVAWTGDEETGGAGIQYQLNNKRASIKAGVAFNEGAAILLGEDGKVRAVNYQVAEKVYQDFELVARGPTGHSSVPQEGNAIYRLSAALDKLGRQKFPPRLLPVTRAYFAARAATESTELAAAMRAISEAKGELPAGALKALAVNPSLEAFLHTTCVATLLSGGTRANALPAEAKANVNCRILPDEKVEDVQARLAAAVDDSGVEIRPVGGRSVVPTPSPVDGPGPAALRKVAAAMWPGVPVIPVLEKGATDSAFLRAVGIPSYGVYPIPMAETDRRRAHGVDERVPAGGLRTGVEFFHRLALEIAG